MAEEVKMETEENVLDLLLGRRPELPTRELKMKRLSKELGADVVFKVRALGYNEVAEYIRGKDDAELRIVLQGLVSPDLKDPRLLQKYEAITPLELLKNGKFLLPGEVAELSLKIENLSGYRETTFAEVRKN